MLNISQIQSTIPIMFLVLTMLVPITIVSVSNAQAVSYEATGGYIQPGNPLWIYLSNGLVNLSGTGDGKMTFFNLDQTVKITRFYSGLHANGSKGIDSASYWLYSRKAYFSPFIDALGTGEQLQWMWWTSPATTLNVSFYFRCYDNERFIISWMETKNSLGYSVNQTDCYYMSYYTYPGGIRVGSSYASMWAWNANSGAYGCWSNSGATTDSREYRYTPLQVITTSLSERSLTLAQVTEEKGGATITTASTTYSTDIYGWQQMTIAFDRQQSDATGLPYEKIWNGANWTSDRFIFSITNSDEIIDALADWQRAVLAFNSLKSETKPVYEGAFYTTWNCYPDNITDTLVRNIANYVSTNYPSIEWINIDGGWVIGDTQAGDIGHMDSLAMQVDLTKFPNMVDLANYIHSKGLKLCLWIDPTNIWKGGSMNATHPEWRVRNADGSAHYALQGGSWHYDADITDTAYLAYLKSQLELIQSAWHVDAFKIDFMAQIQENHLYDNWNISRTHASQAFFRTIANATPDIGLNMFSTPLCWNPMTGGTAFNVFRTTPDMVGDYVGWKSGVLNYSYGYNILRGGVGVQFPLLNYEEISSYYYVWPWTSDQITQAANMIFATGSFFEASFYPGVYPTFDEPASKIFAYANYTGEFFVAGMTGYSHSNLPTAFGRHYNVSLMNSDAIITMINFESNAAYRTVSLADFGVVGSSVVYNEHSNNFTEVSTIYSLYLAAHESNLIAIGKMNGVSQMLYSNAMVTNMTASDVHIIPTYQTTKLVMNNVRYIYYDENLVISNNWTFGIHNYGYGVSNITGSMGIPENIGICFGATTMTGQVQITVTSWNSDASTNGKTVGEWDSYSSSPIRVNYTIIGLRADVGYRVLEDGTTLFQSYSGNPEFTFTSSGDSKIEIQVWAPMQSTYQMAGWILAIGFVVGLSAIIIVAIGSRIRKG